MMVATLGIALPEIRQTFSLTALQAGSLFSVMMLIAAITSGVAGRLADRIGRKSVLITGLSLLASDLAARDQRPSPALLFSLAVTGIGYGFTPPSLYAIMSDFLPTAAVWRQSGLRDLWHRRRHRRRAGEPDHRGLRLARRVRHRRRHRRRRYVAAALLDSRQPHQTDRRRNRLLPRRAVLLILILALAEFIGGSVFWASAAWTPTLLRTDKL